MLRTRLIHPLILLSAILLVLAGCDFADTDDGFPALQSSDVIVANAGAFGGANSSLTFIDPTGEQDPTTTDTFDSYIQSHTVLQDQFLVAFGETATVGIFDLEEAAELGSITDIENPRTIISDGTVAYITRQDFSGESAPEVVEANVPERTVEARIELDENPEGLMVIDDRVYVAMGNEDGSIVVIDRNEREVVETFDPECDAPRALFPDTQNRIVVACTGATIFNDDFEVIDETDGAIRLMDTDGSIIDEQDLDGQLTSASAQQRVAFDFVNNAMFAVINGTTVLRYDPATNDLETIDVEGDPIGAIAYDGVEDQLYLGRPAPNDPFGAAGTVTVHEPGGAEIESFNAGIAPGHIEVRVAQE